MTPDVESAKQARDILQQGYQGILCTNSKELPGYPFGSVVPYILNANCQPVILISTIAQHTKNIIYDNKVSLVVTAAGADDLQSVGRVTYIGDACQLDDQANDAVERYYEFFPHTRDYHKTHGFNFYSIGLQLVRYIGGFGEIFWFGKDKFLMPNPFSLEQEQGILHHMNRDHAEAIKHYCDLYNIQVTDDQNPVMIGIDSEGFHIRIGKRIHRINFRQSVNTNEEARKALIEIARQDAG